MMKCCLVVYLIDITIILSPYAEMSRLPIHVLIHEIVNQNFYKYRRGIELNSCYVDNIQGK